MRRAGCARVPAVLAAAAMLGGLTAPASATPSPGFGCTSPPAPDSATKGGHTKASSFAPHARAHNRAYGAPVQRPILSKRKRHKHHAQNPPAAK